MNTAYLAPLPTHHYCCCQIAVNNNIADVWFFWDSHKMFADWTGVLSKLYMSSAALVTGWVGAVVWYRTIAPVMPCLLHELVPVALRQMPCSEGLPDLLIALVLAGQCVRQVTCHDNAIRSASNCYSNSTHLCMLPLRPFLMTADSGDFLQPVLDWLHP